MSVLLAHVVGPSLPGLSKYIFTGHPAVVAFFVISGFCIHAPYVNRALPVSGFWLARFVRIVIPVAIAWPIASALRMRLFNPVDGYILWSVVCELWYYALYPLFLALHRRWVPFSVQCLIALPVAFVIAFLLGSDQYGNANAFGWQLNWLISLPSWLIGCALAERRCQGPVVLLRFSVAFTASLLYWATMNTPVGYYLTGNLFALLCAAWISSEISTAHGENWLDQMGKWSYSIYLFHAVAWKMVSHTFSAPGIVYVPFILLGCYVFYRLVELPSHQLARRIYRRLTLSAA